MELRCGAAGGGPRRSTVAEVTDASRSCPQFRDEHLLTSCQLVEGRVHKGRKTKSAIISDDDRVWAPDTWTLIQEATG